MEKGLPYFTCLPVQTKTLAEAVKQKINFENEFYKPVKVSCFDKQTRKHLFAAIFAEDRQTSKTFSAMFPEGRQTSKLYFQAMFPKRGQIRKHCFQAMFSEGPPSQEIYCFPPLFLKGGYASNPAVFLKDRQPDIQYVHCDR